MPLPSLQLSFRAQNALIYSRPPSVRVQIPRMMLVTLERFAGPPKGNL